MAKNALKQLEERRDELERLRERCRHLYGRAGFGFLTSPVPLSRQQWRLVSGLVHDFSDKVASVPIEKVDIWVDTFPDGLHCLRWWGKAEAIKDIKKWADETSIALWNNCPAIRSELSHGKGYFGTLSAFYSIASATPAFAELVRKQVIHVDEQVQNELPGSLKLDGVTLSEVSADAVTFASTILKSLVVASGKADPQQIPPLSDRQYYILEAMLSLNATRADARRSTKDIAKEAEGIGADPEGYKEPIAKLVDLGFIGTKEGRGGGCWLTSSGIALAKQLKKR